MVEVGLGSLCVLFVFQEDKAEACGLAVPEINDDVTRADVLEGLTTLLVEELDDVKSVDSERQASQLDRSVHVVLVEVVGEVLILDVGRAVRDQKLDYTEEGLTLHRSCRDRLHAEG